MKKQTNFLKILLTIIFTIILILIPQYLSRFIRYQIFGSGYTELANIIYIILYPFLVIILIFLFNNLYLHVKFRDFRIDDYFNIKPFWLVTALLLPLVFFILLYAFLGGKIVVLPNIGTRLPLILLSYLNGFSIALSEELACRGLLLSVVDKEANRRKAILISSLVFSLIHLINLFSGSDFATVILQIIYSFAFGITLALATIETNSIWNAVLVHGNYNGVISIVSISNQRVNNSADLIDWNITYSKTIVVLMMTIILIILNILIIYFKFGYKKPTKWY